MITEQYDVVSMAIIKQIEIKNFRGIRYLKWNPSLGVNCLIGPGDSGKSSILDAIDLTLGARRRTIFTDADFYLLNIDVPIVIDVTLGDLDDFLKDLEVYGNYHRGWNSNSGRVEPEPGDEFEPALTVRMTVASDLEAEWKLFSERTEGEDEIRDLKWKHRVACSPTRLGPYAAQHFSWGSRSILNQLSDDTVNSGAALAAAGREARKAFGNQTLGGVQTSLDAIEAVAKEIGVPLTKAKALLDIQGISLSGGSVSIHDERDVPLRSMGLGSSRLLVAGMQKRASASVPIALIDEIEHGLEPYRIVRLLGSLGSKGHEAPKQVFMTSHSPVVLRELSGGQLHVARELPSKTEASSHQVVIANEVPFSQATVRSCAEAFLSPSVLVCEGKTEVGLIRGLDYFNISIGRQSISAIGAYPADGGGSNACQRALVFAQLGYRVAVFLDNDLKDDKEQEARKKELVDLVAAKVDIFCWGDGLATEEVLFSGVPSNQINSLLDIAIEKKGIESVRSQIANSSSNQFSYDSCIASFQDSMRESLAKAAKKGSWFKDVDPAERIGREILGPEIMNCDKEITSLISSISSWLYKGSEGQETVSGNEIDL